MSDACKAGENVEPQNIGVSIEACYLGSVCARECLNDPAFMAEDNWSAELAVRIFRVMVSQSVSEGSLAILIRAYPLDASYAK